MWLADPAHKNWAKTKTKSIKKIIIINKNLWNQINFRLNFQPVKKRNCEHALSRERPQNFNQQTLIPLIPLKLKILTFHHKTLDCKTPLFWWIVGTPIVIGKLQKESLLGIPETPNTIPSLSIVSPCIVQSIQLLICSYHLYSFMWGHWTVRQV